jgi:hypothetical protein
MSDRYIKYMKSKFGTALALVAVLLTGTAAAAINTQALIGPTETTLGTAATTLLPVDQAASVAEVVAPSATDPSAAIANSESPSSQTVNPGSSSVSTSQPSSSVSPSPSPSVVYGNPNPSSGDDDEDEDEDEEDEDDDDDDDDEDGDDD